jgi:HSP20 family molecular chaperone IbpA
VNILPKNFFLDDILDDILTIRDNNSLKCDIYEQGDKYYIEMDANGFKKEDLNIECDKGYLNITIAKKEEKKDEGRTYIRKERYSQECKRSFYVGEVDPDNIKAEFIDGLLKVSISKTEMQKSKKNIEVE